MGKQDKRQRSQKWLNKSKDGRGPGQGKSAGYEITDGSPPGKHTKGNHIEEDR